MEDDYDEVYEEEEDRKERNKDRLTGRHIWTEKDKVIQEKTRLKKEKKPDDDKVYEEEGGRGREGNKDRLTGKHTDR